MSQGARDGHTESMLPEQEVRFEPTVHRVHRRPFGLSPVPVLAVVAAVSLVIAVLLFVLVSWVAGILFLLLSGVVAALFRVGVRREPDEQTSRLAMSAAGTADGWARQAAVGVRAWAHAAPELVRLWTRRRRLRFALKRQLAPLGEAVHLGDQARAEQLKAQANQLDREIRDTDQRASDALAELRNEIERERAVRQSTQMLPVVDETQVSERDGQASSKPPAA